MNIRFPCIAQLNHLVHGAEHDLSINHSIHGLADHNYSFRNLSVKLETETNINITLPLTEALAKWSEVLHSSIKLLKAIPLLIK